MADRERRIRAIDPCDGVEEPVPVLETDPDKVTPYLEDASGSTGGSASGLLRGRSERAFSAWLRATAADRVKVLPQAGRSSLTGGGHPEGEVVLSVERLRDLEIRSAGGGGCRVEAGPGLRLAELQEELRKHRLYYPPVPTYQEAMLGGTVSTNAGGAATFKYGVTRQWVDGIRVLLFNGDLLEIERGRCLARPGERFEVELSDGSLLQVPAPTYRLPPLKKISAGYHAADPLDLLDLFIGSEGTLGLVTRVTVRTVPLPASILSGLAFPENDRAAFRLAAGLRQAAVECRGRNDPLGPDIRAVEWVDSRSLALLERYGDLSDLKLRLPDGAGSAVLLEMELPEAMEQEQVIDLLEGYLERRDGLPDGPVVRLFRILDEAGCLDSLLPALPGDERARERLRRFREAVPLRVNEILSSRRAAAAGPRKVGGDLIVPFSLLDSFLSAVEKEFGDRGLEFAIWGHLSDGNLHPNLLPMDADQVRAGEEALLALGLQAAAMGGAPLSEHGVGRSRLKKELLLRFLGKQAVEEMRSVKSALDPAGRFSPGTLLPS